MASKNLKIAVLPGDGIGPEVIDVAVKVMKAVCNKMGHKVSFQYGEVGAVAIDKYGNPYPDETHEICEASDAVLFGAVGDPRFDNNPNAKVRPEQGLLAMRKKLGLFANIRPIETFDALLDKSPLKPEVCKGADFICIRELTGGLYFGRPQGRSETGETAYDTCIYTSEEINRILKVAFDYAMKRKKHVTLVDKANILSTSRMWRELAKKMAANYPEVTMDCIYVDNAAMQLVQCPTRFDVIVTENMFGDILTDEASVITGSMGLMASASIGAKNSLYEPIHGSYPQAAGKNIANPLATVLSVAMMFETSFDLKKEGQMIRDAVAKTIEEKYVTEDLAQKGDKSYSTSEVGERLINLIQND
ncbi:MAG: 3-isopropylmalate dehydrogenase [Paludibacteraceae bacterium]|nr:3-isopropylmalate dehydrogenase [Paludibacteraceae bacterium]